MGHRNCGIRPNLRPLGAASLTLTHFRTAPLLGTPSLTQNAKQRRAQLMRHGVQDLLLG